VAIPALHTLKDDLHFLLTNRLPRRWATQFMGWFSAIEVGWVRDLSLAAWRLCAPELDLSEAKKERFDSLHDCFVRELRDGARPVNADPRVVVSPCDAIVGAHGRIDGTQVFQAKGFPYSLHDLLGDRELVERHRDGLFVTLRLKSTMYHRFHAPCDGELREVTYIAGDTWNVHPIALRRVERLFCRNERAVLDVDPSRGGALRRSGFLTLVPVAAILVASIRLHCLPQPLDMHYRGAQRIPCNSEFVKGDELGFFEHGSTILVFASGDFGFSEHVVEGATIRMGQPLLRNESWSS
jgi:phosphatidylserine decarboxylase